LLGKRCWKNWKERSKCEEEEKRNKKEWNNMVFLKVGAPTILKVLVKGRKVVLMEVMLMQTSRMMIMMYRFLAN
jgi:hypothetical protein